MSETRYIERQSDFSGGIGEHPERLGSDEIAAARYIDCVSEAPGLRMGELLDVYRPPIRTDEGNATTQLRHVGLWFTGWLSRDTDTSGTPQSSGVNTVRLPYPTVTVNAERGNDPPAYVSLMAISSIRTSTATVGPAAIPASTLVKEYMLNEKGSGDPLATGLSLDTLYYPTQSTSSTYLTASDTGAENIAGAALTAPRILPYMQVDPYSGMVMFLASSKRYGGFRGAVPPAYELFILRSIGDFSLAEDWSPSASERYTREFNSNVYGLSVAQSSTRMRDLLSVARNNGVRGFTPRVGENALYPNIDREPSEFILESEASFSRSQSSPQFSSEKDVLVGSASIGEYFFYALSGHSSVTGVSPYKTFLQQDGTRKRPYKTVTVSAGPPQVTSRVYKEENVVRLNLPPAEEVTHLYAEGAYLTIYTVPRVSGNYKNTFSQRYRWDTTDIIVNPNNPADITRRWESVTSITGRVRFATLWRGVDWVVLETGKGELQVGYMSGDEFIPVKTLPYTLHPVPFTDADDNAVVRSLQGRRFIRGTVYRDQLVITGNLKQRWSRAAKPIATVLTISRGEDGSFTLSAPDEVESPIEILTAKEDDRYTAIAAAQTNGRLCMNIWWPDKPRLDIKSKGFGGIAASRTGTAEFRMVRKPEGGRAMRAEYVSAVVDNLVTGNTDQGVQLGLRSGYEEDYHWISVFGRGNETIGGQRRFELPGDQFNLRDTNGLQMAVRIGAGGRRGGGQGASAGAPTPIIRSVEMRYAVSE